jgi:beta-glucosidase
MKRIIFVAIACIALVVTSCNNTKEPKDSIDKKVESLLSQMTLEEKIGQMTQITINYMLEGTEVYKANLPYKLDEDSLQKTIVDQHVGSIFGGARAPFTLQQWREFTTNIQEYSTKTRLQIPVIYGVDAIHGGTFVTGATLFPQQIGLAATWNPELVKNLAEISAYECKATGVPWNFSPVLDMGRNPLWSRYFETFGEDVFLARTMGNAVIEGYQGDSPANAFNVSACMKHFVGYSLPLSGKDRTQTWIDERMLREYFLPTFEDAIKLGTKTLMVNSGELNGIPVHASKHLLTDVLRKELGFKGIVVTDFKDIILLHKSHHVASTYKEAVKIAINAGIDMSMVPMDFDFQKHLLELVNEGQVPISRINESVRRILRVKYELGLFEQPLPDFTKYPKFGSKEHASISRAGAQESITLLKNRDQILPFNPNEKIMVCGPTADEMNFLNGPWSYTWQGKEEKYYLKEKNTIREAIQLIGTNQVHYYKAASLDSIYDINNLKKEVNGIETVVVCLGEQHGVEEAGNINHYALPEAQYQLIEELHKLNKRIILLITAGRPQIISPIEEYCDAILMCYLPGNEGGDAIADILYGNVNPSGKLPFTWPKYPHTISLYDHKYTDHNIEGKQAPYQPQYEFGYGLSYTQFKYTDLHIALSGDSNNDSLFVEVNVKNIGNRAGKEVVQLYISDLYASITPSVKRLRAFEKVSILPGKDRTISFKIALKELAFVGMDYKWTLEPGTFEVQIENLNKSFTIK